MNRYELRQRMKTLLSRSVPETDLDFSGRCNQSIDLALRRVSNEVPQAVIPSLDTLHLLPSYQTGVAGMTSTCSTTSDEWVLSLGTPPFAAPDLVTQVDGTWDGSYWIEVELSDGSYVRRQCREFWAVTDGLGNRLIQYVSLAIPLKGVTFSARSFRLYHPYAYLPQDVEEILDGTIEDVRSGIIQTLNEGFAREVGVLDGVNGPTGQPSALARSKYYQLDAPQRTPTASLVAGTFGPEAIGTFTYCYTYAWGKRPAANPSEASTLRPLFESGPSPASAAVTVTNAAAQSVQISLVSIDHMIGFDEAGTLRQTHSGLTKRIYRARTSIGTGTVTAIEAAGVYQFLAEVDGAATSYTDDGSDIPEYYTRLPEVAGYYAYRPYPNQDTAYTLQLRTYRRARGLDADQDQAPISPECIDALLSYAVSYLCHYDQAPELATFWAKEAERCIGTFRARHANPSKIHPSRVWGTSYDNWSSNTPFLTWTRVT